MDRVFLAGQMPGLYMASTGFFWMEPETLPNMNYQFRQPVNAVAFEISDAYGVQSIGGLCLSTDAGRASTAVRPTGTSCTPKSPWLLPYSGAANVGAYNNNRVGGFRYSQIVSGKVFKEDLWLKA